MDKNVLSRRSSQKDADGIGRVHVECWRETYSGILPEKYLNTLSIESRASMWSSSLENIEQRNWIWVAEADDKIVGFIYGGDPREDTPYDSELYAIYLLKAFQGLGLGKKLFNTIAAALKRQGKRSMYLWVLKENPTCLVYEALGGAPTQIEKTISIGGKPLEEIIYSFKL